MNTETLPVAAIPSVAADLPKPTIPPPERLTMSSVFGSLEALGEAEQLELMSLESTVNDAIDQGWRSFVDIGLALIQIRDKKLYRADCCTFEEFYLAKWNFRHSKANYLMAAAEVVTKIAALPDLPRPEHEGTVRPMIHLEPEDVQKVWKRALERVGEGRISARVVKSVIHELNLGVSRPAGPSPHQQQLDRHQRINDCFGELLKLLSHRADYPSVIEKVQELHGHVGSLMGRRRSRLKS